MRLISESGVQQVVPEGMRPPDQEETRAVPAGLITDCLLLVIVAVLAVAPFLGGLGFYSDDWAFLARLHGSANQSLPGLVQAVWGDPATHPRPVQAFWVALLYWIFGLHPLGYQAIDACVAGISGLLLYGLLRAFHVLRPLALACAALFLVLPNAMAAQRWIVAAVVALSLLLCLASLACGLIAIRRRSWLWAVTSLALVVVTVFTYEVVLGLCLLSAALFWYWGRRDAMGRVLAVGTVGLVVLSLPVKTLLTNRVAQEHTSLVQAPSHLLVAIHANYGAYLLHLPRALRWSSTQGLTVLDVVWVALLGLVVLAGLWRASRDGRPLPALPATGRLTFVGLALFAVGFADFVWIGLALTPTGLGNRLMAAGMPGFALSLVGGVALVAALLRRFGIGWWAFRLLVALLASAYALLGATLGQYWTATYQQERAVIAAITRQMPSPFPRTIILDGMCPYNGPLPIFDTAWDLTGALQLRYGAHAPQADTVTASLDVKPDGLHTTMDGGIGDYSYEDLVVYNRAENRLIRLPTYVSAQRYFRGRDLNNGCPGGENESGLPLW